MTVLEASSSELAIIEERKAKVLESLEAIELLILNIKEPLTKELEALELKVKELDSIKADEMKRYKSLIAEKLWDLIEEHLTEETCPFTPDKSMVVFYSTHRLRFIFNFRYREIYVDFNGISIITINASSSGIYAPEVFSIIKERRYTNESKVGVSTRFPDNADQLIELAIHLKLIGEDE